MVTIRSAVAARITCWRKGIAIVCKVEYMKEKGVEREFANTIVAAVNISLAAVAVEAEPVFSSDWSLVASPHIARPFEHWMSEVKNEQMLDR